jgi:hypothetical protein
MPPLDMILSQFQTHKTSHSKIYVFDSRLRKFAITNIKVLRSSKSRAIFTYRLGPILLYVPTISCLLLFFYVLLGLQSGRFPQDVGKRPSLFVCMWARPNRTNVKFVLAHRQTERQTRQCSRAFAVPLALMCASLHRSWNIPLHVIVGFIFFSFPLVLCFSCDYYYASSRLWQLIKTK